MDALLNHVIGLVSRAGHWSYFVLFSAAALESAAFLGLLVPGESVVLAAGFLAAQGVLDLDVLIGVVTLGAIVGDNVGYELGRRLGEAWLLGHARWTGLTEERLEEGRRFFQRHGGKSIFFGRFVGFARAVVPFVAGASRMPYARFLLANAVGGASWAVAITLAGYLLGASWSLAEKWIGRASLVLAVLLVILLVLSWAARWVSRHEAAIRGAVSGLASRPRIAAIRERLAPAIAFLVARLSPTGYLGLHFSIGAVIFVAAAWLFGGITEDILTGDPLVVVDTFVAGWLAQHSVGWLTGIMEAISAMHGTLPVVGMFLALALYLALGRRVYWLLALFVAVPGGMGITVMEKLAFHRARPDFGNALRLADGYSFPSGHAAAATLLYGFLAAFLWTRTSAWPRKVSFVAAALMIVVIVAFSRMYLGAHFLSDVLAAMAGSVAWLALTLTGIRALRLHRAPGAAGLE